ncbi:MAG: RNA pseudouridine synthase [Isosphaeraceae bacterium]|jgi:RluA family pseudouridine synthase|nr:MAG: RNA pseudouridine synthase [Isosphaeraceae bacterium]
MLTIVYEDSALLVVSKPAGLSTQAPPIAGPTLEQAVRAYLNPGNPAAAYAGTLHRLDRPVSGLVAWAKTPAAARHVSRQFQQRRVHKLYWALVEGRPHAGPQIWDDWLVRDPTGLGRAQTCAPGTPRAQPARTFVQILAPVAGFTWLALRPETGRTHQLRIQAASRGLPILGDSLYGATTPFAPNAIALHARELAFLHPDDGRPLRFQAPVSSPWPSLPDADPPIPDLDPILGRLSDHLLNTLAPPRPPSGNPNLLDPEP